MQVVSFSFVQCTTTVLPFHLNDLHQKLRMVMSHQKHKLLEMKLLSNLSVDDIPELVSALKSRNIDTLINSVSMLLHLVGMKVESQIAASINAGMVPILVKFLDQYDYCAKLMKWV
jgi:hypothetical protein